MSKHTAGPWIAEDVTRGRIPDAGCGVIASSDELKISNPSRGIVAWATRHVGQTNTEVEANAKLIAAAPDMLAALKEAQRYVEYLVMGSFIGPGMPRDALKQINAAIAKAEADKCVS